MLADDDEAESGVSDTGFKRNVMQRYKRFQIPPAGWKA
jgi:hypothetical protein